MLGDEGARPLVEAFLGERLHQAGARHLQWTREAYARAWPREHGFWAARSAPVPVAELRQRGLEGLARSLEAAPAPVDAAAGSPPPADLMALQQAPRLSPRLTTTVVPCAMPDAIRAQPAIEHPGLDAPVAFVMERAIVPMLMQTGQARSFRELVRLWSRDMPVPQAVRICAWLLHKGILIAAP